MTGDTALQALQWTKTLVEIIKWVGDTIIAFVSGDDSPEVTRLINILPAHYKADIEHQREREKLRRELEALDGGRTP